MMLRLQLWGGDDPKKCFSEVFILVSVLHLSGFDLSFENDKQIYLHPYEENQRAYFHFIWLLRITGTIARSFCFLVFQFTQG